MFKTTRTSASTATVISFVLALAVTLASFGSSQTGRPATLELAFFNHLQGGMNEQDVFIERDAGAAEVYRITAEDTDLSVMLYTSAVPTNHNPVNPDDVGPFPKGESLGVTLGEWLEARGQATLTCEGERGSISASFENLIPGGTYTLWYFFMAMPASEPFSTYDLPIGARDGSESVFTADENGSATHEVSFSPCLQLSGEQLMAGLAIAYHSDGKTYGSYPGTFGDISHLQLLVFLPSATEIAGN